MADENAKSYLIGMKFATGGVFGVADYESEINIQKFKMADPI